MRINIETCPMSKMRYETAGDYWKDKKGVWQFRILELHNPIYEILILIHELVEWVLCLVAGIPVREIDAFDIQFEKDRRKGAHATDAEPGDHPKAPYRYQHWVATKVELWACEKMGIRWEDYDRAVRNG